MDWLDEAIERLAAQPVCGYQPDAAATVEPTALAALALLAAGRIDPPAAALDWLLTVQSADGSLGVDLHIHQPCWPTGWATLAWDTGAKTIPNAKAQWAEAARHATAWMLSTAGRPVDAGATPHAENANSEDIQFYGHNTMLQGWPWVVGTHSWVEPTAMALLALRSRGQADHPRAREAVALLLDRQLPEGGWNYGNTVILGAVLRPQVEATGLTLAALAGETGIGPKVQRSIDWLSHAISERTAAASLGYALWGLRRFGLNPSAADAWLSAVARRTLTHDGSPYRLALLALAASGREFHA